MDASKASSQATPKKQFAIGIDLGTSFSAVAVYQANNENRNAEVVHDAQGNAVIPSIVAFTKNAQLVGYKALDQIAANPENTICEVKRLMGRKFDDPQVQKEIKRWPFTLLNFEGEPRLQVKHRNEIRQYRPEQIAAMILLHLKNRTCDFVKAPAFSEINAVLTVPVNFGESQRLAIKEACQISKINCLRFITEPSAVALAYAWHNELHEGERDRGGLILVFDMGGGTTDVSIVQIGSKQQYEVVGSVGEDIGGADFDTILTYYCLKNNNLSAAINTTIKNNKGALIRMRRACERAKCNLSTKCDVSFELDEILPDDRLTFKISIADFEKLIDTKVQKAVSLIGDCVSSAGISARHIEKVILAGGSSRIPYVQKMIKQNLPGNIPILSDLCKDEVVACGAALQAAQDSNLLDLRIIEIIPWSLGVRVHRYSNNRTISRIIEKNSLMPASNTVNYYTSYDDQSAMGIKIFEGESFVAKENKLLGEMKLENIRKAPAGEVKAKVTFEVDKYGILQATAIESGTKNTISVKFDRNKNLLSTKAVEGLTKDAEKENLLGIVLDLQERLGGLEVEVAPEHRLGVIAQANKVKKWQQQNLNIDVNNFGQLINNLQEDLQDTGITVSNHGVIHCRK